MLSYAMQLDFFLYWKTNLATHDRIETCLHSYLLRQLQQRRTISRRTFSFKQVQTSARCGFSITNHEEGATKSSDGFTTTQLLSLWFAAALFGKMESYNLNAKPRIKWISLL